MAEFFFESMDVPALFIAPQPLLSMYASGRGTGVVVDVGEGVTTLFPIYDGFSITPHIQRVDLGGKEMTQYLQLLLRKSGYIFSKALRYSVDTFAFSRMILNTLSRTDFIFPRCASASLRRAISLLLYEKKKNHQQYYGEYRNTHNENDTC